MILKVPAKGTIYDPNGLLQVIVNCGGYYNAIINDHITGPLVAYAGKYDSPSGQENYVGFEYFNFAKVEEHPVQLNRFANEICSHLSVQAVVAAPMGGLALGALTALKMNAGFYYPEKHVIEVVENGRNKTELRWDRHTLPPRGLNVAIVEDVINNSSTTATMIELIESQGSSVVAIVCGLLRAEAKEFDYNGRKIPITPAIHRITDQFRQDDPAVAGSIIAGDVEWKAKDNWGKLQAKLEARYDAFK